jgi:hypothetical protein
MRNNPSSDIPKARSLLTTALRTRDWRYVKAALPLMVRAKPVRRAPPTRHKITAKQFRETQRLAAAEPGTSLHVITNRVGLPNAGRASEIITGKRKISH